MMLRDKLERQVRGQFLSRDITFMLHRWLRYTVSWLQNNKMLLFVIFGQIQEKLYFRKRAIKMQLREERLS